MPAGFRWPALSVVAYAASMTSAPSSSAIRVLLADDQGLIRAGFRVLLEAAADVTVVGEAVNGAQAGTLARELRADVVRMDIRMPEVHGLGAAPRIAPDVDLPGAPVVSCLTV